MNLPPRIVEIVHILYDRNLTLAHGSEDDRRKLTRLIAEQIRFELGEEWGTKATSSRAPQSKDAIAFLKSRNPDVMDIWDWQSGSTKLPSIKANQKPDYPDEKQFFIHVSPVDHIGGVVPGNGNGDNGDDNNNNNDEHESITNRLDALQELVNAQNELLQALSVQILGLVDKGITVTFPEYESNNIRFFGVITLKPKA